jgi:lipopolysaccharide biosynthesis glycosyltransferase
LIKDTEVDCPIPIEGAIPVLLSCNDYYVPYLGSTILSLAKTTKSKLDIIVLNREITEASINLIQSLIKDYPHVSVRFINVSSRLNKYALTVHEHISMDTFSRLLIPIILKEYDKIIYLDSDLILRGDISTLYSMDLGNNTLAGVIDIGYVSLYNGNDKRIVESADNALNLSDPYKYINAGVLVIDVKKLCEKYPGDYLINYASEYDHMYMDQDIINKLFEGDILHLDQCWNTMHYHSGERKRLIGMYAPRNLAEEYMNARKNPQIIHYAGNRKPWNDEYEDFAKEYWELISGTLLYNIIFSRHLSQTIEWRLNQTIGERLADIKHPNRSDGRPKRRFARWIMSGIDRKYPYPTK